MSVKRQTRDAVRALLQAARPLKPQLRAAEEARDKASRRHAALSEEVHKLTLISESKEKEMSAAAAEVKSTTAQASAIHEKLIKEVPTADSSPVLAAPPSPLQQPSFVQLAASFVNSLRPAARESFNAWLQSAPVDAMG